MAGLRAMDAEPGASLEAEPSAWKKRPDGDGVDELRLAS
jgi:hypothetical protein